MAINKLWIILAAAVLLLLVAVLALSRPHVSNTSEADAAHNAFMVQGAANDHETGVSSPLGSGNPKPTANEQDVPSPSNDHETGTSSSFGSGRSKHH